MAFELPRTTPGLVRAYVVQDPDEERATVVYARNPMEARRLGHCVDDVGAMNDEDELLVERAEYLDDLRGRSLIEVQLAHGWWFGCGYCERRVSYDEDEDGAFEPHIRGDDVYCSGWCAGAEAVRHVDQRIRTWEALEWATARFAGARIESVWPTTFGFEDRSQLVATVHLRVPPRFEFQFAVQRGQTMMVTEAAAAEWHAYQAAKEAS